jgi:NAD(P)-dependent dehydrogenase (short-subunit alcohol dehydrogenase family)
MFYMPVRRRASVDSSRAAVARRRGIELTSSASANEVRAPPRRETELKEMATRIKVALVTGAASGLGRLSAERLRAAGASVAALDIDAENLARVVAGRPGTYAYACDVTDEARVREIVDEVERTMGPLDRVVHAPAIMPGGWLLEQGASLTGKVMRINYEGAVNVVHATLPRMLERRQGEWVCFGSVAGFALTPGLGAYCASKAALNAYFETLIHETAGRGVVVHLACPPMVDTPLIEQAMNLTSFQVMAAKKLLASPDKVLDAIDAAVARGQNISFPLPMAKWLYAMRRFAPSLLWQLIERSSAPAASGLGAARSR